ncbi:MAG: HAD family hydrolase [Micromonosporaceae bacterium]
MASREAAPAPAPAEAEPTPLAPASAEAEPTPPAPPDISAAAFFDVDNTMLRGASIYWLARGLAAHNYFTTGDLARFGWQQLKFRLTSEDAGDMAAARQAALAFIAGRRADEMARLSESVYDDLMEQRIWAGTRAMAQMHLDAGQRVWLVTAAPVEVARLIARRLGLTGALGTVAEIDDDGTYTGHLIGDLLHGDAKAEAVKALAAREGLDLTRCSAYSDSYNDLPMLTTVGRAVAVNPDSALRREARHKGWEVRDFRTARKAAKVAVPTVFGAGAAAGVVFGALAMRRRRKPPP